MSKKYRYALVNRPACYGAIPPGVYRVDPRPEPGEDHHEMARHGVIVYDRELTEQEQISYELAPLIDGETRATLAVKIAASWDDDDVRYILSIADEYPDEIRMGVSYAIRREFGKRRVSIGNIDTFTGQVLAAMAAAHG